MRSQKIKLSWIILATSLAGLLALIFVPVGIFLGVYGYYQYFALVYPRVYAGDMSLGGNTFEDAAIELHLQWNLENHISLTDGIHSWLVAPSEIGLFLDANLTAQKAYNYGHGGSMMAELGQLLYSLRNGWSVEPVIKLDLATAQNKIEEYSLQAAKPPKDAEIRYQDGKFISIPSELGYTFNVEETLDLLAADPAAVLTQKHLQIVLKPLSPQIEDVSSTLDAAQDLLERPVYIRAYDPIYDEHFEWSVPGTIVGSWIEVDDTQTLVLSFNDESVASYINSLSSELGSARRLDGTNYSGSPADKTASQIYLDVPIRHQSTTYTVQKGDTLLKIGWNSGIPFWMIINANPGLDPDKIQAGQELVIPPKDALLPLPVIPEKRIVILIGRQRLMVYENGELLSKNLISTGVDRSPTQPGVFQVQTHEKKAYASVWDLTMPNFLGIYEAWPGFMNGIHGLPILSNGRVLWANILGKPASYGCIILDTKTAKWLYNWAEDGVIVEIKP